MNYVESAIIKTVRKNGQITRSELALHLGYSRAAMTGFVSNLMEEGILAEVGTGASKGGRKPLILEINGDYGFILGYDIGATSIDIALANFKGDILEHCAESANVRDDAVDVLGRCNSLALALLKKSGGKYSQVLAVGIGVPGPVEFSKGILIAPPLMPTWENFRIKDFTRETFQNAVVVIDNDVNVMAIGEAKAGAGKNVNNFIFVKIGTGIGSGIFANGEIYRGTMGAAGNIGHIAVASTYHATCHCGHMDCLEALAAGPPIANRGKEAAEHGDSDYLSERLKLQDGKLTAKDISDAAATGDLVAISIIRDSGGMIGSVLAGLVEFFNPELILIGGGVSNIANDLLSTIRQGVLLRANPLSTRDLRIEFSSLEDQAGVIGAIWLTFDQIFDVEMRGDAR